MIVVKRKVLYLLLFLWASSQNDLLSIQDAIQAGDLNTASRLIAESLHRNPKDAGVLNLRGVVHAQRQELIAARKDFAEAVQLDPNLTPAWQNLARACQIQVGQDSSALSCAVNSWERVSRLKPGDKEALDSLRPLLERIASADPKNPAPLVELARVADAAKDHQGALGYLAHARDLEPGNAQVHFLFAEIAMEMDLVMQARASLNEALKLDPPNPAYNYAMGFVILQTRDAATAAGYFQKFLAAKPDNASGHYALGIAFYASGDYVKSKEEMQRVESDPKTAGGAEYFLGRMARQEGDLDGAARHLNKSIDLLPTFSESHTELGRIWMEKGDLQKARAELDRAVQLDPQSFEANMQLLVVYRRTQDPRATNQAEVVKTLDANRSKRAELALRTVEARPIVASPETDSFVSAMALIKAGDDERARTILTELLAQHPDKAIYIYWLGRIDYDQRRYQEAAAKLQKAAELDPKSARIQDSLGNALDMQGLMDQALSTFEHGAELNRADSHPSPWPPHDLGYLLLRMDKLKEAEQALRESVRYDSKLAQTHYYLGRTLEKEDRDEDAIEEYKQAVAEDANSAEACYSLGTLYRKMGRQRDADAMFAEYKKRKAARP